jgi:hypothetical protein
MKGLVSRNEVRRIASRAEETSYGRKGAIRGSREAAYLLRRQHLPILLIKLPDRNHLHALELRDLHASLVGQLPHHTVSAASP